jgi:hypothetical protein
MAGRGATTFQKRQKEQARKEKRDAKIARRQQKKNDAGHSSEAPLDDAALEHEAGDEQNPDAREEAF